MQYRAEAQSIFQLTYDGALEPLAYVRHMVIEKEGRCEGWLGVESGRHEVIRCEDITSGVGGTYQGRAASGSILWWTRWGRCG